MLPADTVVPSFTKFEGSPGRKGGGEWGRECLTNMENIKKYKREKNGMDYFM